MSQNAPLALGVAAFGSNVETIVDFLISICFAFRRIYTFFVWWYKALTLTISEPPP